MLLIYLERISPRTNYVFDLVFKMQFEIEYSVTQDLKFFENYQGVKIYYATSRKSEEEFFVKSAPLLLENFIEKKDISVSEKHGTKILFPNQASCDMGFDVFSAIFYMISRYEEYLPFIPGECVRFKAEDCFA